LAAGCRPALVRSGKGAKSEGKLTSTAGLEHTPVFNDLAAFTDHLLAD